MSVDAVSPLDEPALAVALRDVLRAVARELDLIAELGERVQTAISPLLVEARGEALQAQDLDALVQHACGLGAFVAALGDRCPEGWAASPSQAARDLSLHAQRARLSAPLLADIVTAPPGQVEFF